LVRNWVRPSQGKKVGGLGKGKAFKKEGTLLKGNLGWGRKFRALFNPGFKERFGV